MTLSFDAADARQTLTLPPRLRVLDFISDLHLAPDHPRTAAAFAAYLEDPTRDALFVLGDLFEAWIGDDLLDAASEADSFESAIAARLRQATRDRPIWLMHGNRDFLVGDRFFQATGIEPLFDPTLLRSACGEVLLTHGDALCLADVDYLRFRAVVRSAEWQRRTLSRPLAERRALARSARHASETRLQGRDDGIDVDAPAAAALLAEASTTRMIHGHTHRPGTHAFAAGLQRHVLSDWDFDDPAAPRADAVRLTARGLERIDCRPFG